MSSKGRLFAGCTVALVTPFERGEVDYDAAIVDVSLGKDNSYPLVEALIARGLPFALATGYGQDGIEPRYRGRLMLRKPFASISPTSPVRSQPSWVSAAAVASGSL